MTGQFPARRYGQDTPSRIAVAAELSMEASEMPPIPTYQPLVPFYPPSVITGTGATAGTGSDDEIDTWKQFPGRLDLYSYQGDDVIIPLYFSDPADPMLDMSDENGCSWKSQVRTLHTYRSTLRMEFTVESSYTPPEPADPLSLGVTQVSLFLPRRYNNYVGKFRWDVACTSPYSGPTDFPKPVDYPEDEPWPPEDSLRTWLYGLYYSVPRATSTDWLPPPGTLAVGTGAMAVVVTPSGFTVGPNGRVP